MINVLKRNGGPFIQVLSEVGHGIDSLLKNHYNPPHWITRKTFQNHANPVKSGTIVGQKNISTFFQWKVQFERSVLIIGCCRSAQIDAQKTEKNQRGISIVDNERGSLFSGPSDTHRTKQFNPANSQKIRKSLTLRLMCRRLVT